MKGIPRGRMHIAHVRDVVRAHIAAVDRGGEGEKYLLAGERTSYDKLFNLIAERLGVEFNAGMVPPLVLQTVGLVQVLQSLFTNKPPDMTPRMAKMLSANLDADTDKAERILGFEQTPVEECVDDCINWLRAENLL